MKRDTIIIVDDMEINRAILRGVFEKDYNLLEAENGNQALLLVEQISQQYCGHAFGSGYACKRRVSGDDGAGKQ